MGVVKMNKIVSLSLLLFVLMLTTGCDIDVENTEYMSKVRLREAKIRYLDKAEKNDPIAARIVAEQEREKEYVPVPVPVTVYRNH